MNRSEKSSRLVGVFFAALLLLNFPILGMFKGKSMTLGIPTFYWYLLIVWILLIFVTYRLVEEPGKTKL